MNVCIYIFYEAIKYFLGSYQIKYLEFDKVRWMKCEYDDEDAKRWLKSDELQEEKERLRIATNFIPPAINTKAIHDHNFTGRVSSCVSLINV